VFFEIVLTVFLTVFFVFFCFFLEKNKKGKNKMKMWCFKSGKLRNKDNAEGIFDEPVVGMVSSREMRYTKRYFFVSRFFRDFEPFLQQQKTQTKGNKNVHEKSIIY